MHPNKAPQAFWSTLKKLGGMGRGAAFTTPIEYQGKTANSPQEVADLTADYSKDTFQPLTDPKFNHRKIALIEQELRTALPLLDLPTSEDLTPPSDPDEDLGQYNPYLKEGLLGDDEGRILKPTPTRHQRIEQQLEHHDEYLGTKRVLPPANNPNYQVDEQWDEMRAHNSPTGRLLYEDMLRPISFSEVARVIKNVKRKPQYMTAST